jgi:hypothetical protein
MSSIDPYLQPKPYKPPRLSITEILRKFAEDFAMPDGEGHWWGHDTDLGDMADEFATAEAKLQRYIEEQIIGPDLLVLDPNDDSYNSDEREIGKASAVINALKAEQRARLRGK